MTAVLKKRPAIPKFAAVGDFYDRSVALLATFRKIMEGQAVVPLYQPIVDLQTGEIMGYEGLIRGPENSSLHSPLALFNVARMCGETVQLESLCCKVHIENFALLELPGKLFLNMSPDVFLLPTSEQHPLVEPFAVALLDVGNIVIELTESNAAANYAMLRQAAADRRGYGMQIAIDDLGEGFSSLRLWSELRPEYVKIDKYFIRDIDKDLVKQQFVRSIVEIAQQAGASIIAEGIETEAELGVARSLGVPYGQGYLLARPAMPPLRVLTPDIKRLFRRPAGQAPAVPNGAYKSVTTARKILRRVPSVPDSTLTNEVYEIFEKQPDLDLLAVLRGDAPIGVIHRVRMLDRLARPYHRELYGNKPCSQFIEQAPLIVDHQISLHKLGHLITESRPQHLSDGFIITERGRYIGVGTGFDLIREITQMQIHAARYANPLTQLPGNVPINEHIEALVDSEATFSVCYVDLDHFKPFNDLYSYRKGDEAIQITAGLLQDHADTAIDFVGHIGGDDFIVVFRSADWQDRCQRVLDSFPAATARLYTAEHLAAGGYVTENRQSQEVFHPLISLSLGVVNIPTALPFSSHQIAELAATAKSQAKRIPGNSLFIERRSLLAAAAEGQQQGSPVAVMPR